MMKRELTGCGFASICGRG